ncbi:NusG domain II-containing protein [Wenzhouxiangella sp. XN24]|uniref:NusG domain II-containing protein n=1 Tax=Wenzhouxiangella sp. XN24 TaxID=2713569 RepID=UPI0013EA2922|nr:NusG domain II-containing protein [Wenzhouxiangella sp. XN24]NGX16064.1 NusG domain II-containing protein [Wenzhouxiangella sp. XN24]
MTLVRPADALVVALAALLVGAAWAALWTGGGPAEAVQVITPGDEPRRVALSRDDALEVRGRLGDSRIEIRDGRVRFVDSPCVGRYCVHAGWLSRSGQVAACLPNGVVIEVTGGDREFDAVTF